MLQEIPGKRARDGRRQRASNTAEFVRRVPERWGDAHVRKTQDEEAAALSIAARCDTRAIHQQKKRKRIEECLAG